MLYFLLVSGDSFLRRTVEILPKLSDKRQAVGISQQVQEDVSAYLVTIAAMNAAVGIATAAAMYLCGLGDPLLWGATAFLLNYIPILGPLFGTVIFLLAGMLCFESLWVALVHGGSLFRDSPGGGRNADAYAARSPLHAQSCARHFVAVVLVLDVGRAWSDTGRANTCYCEDHL